MLFGRGAGKKRAVHPRAIRGRDGAQLSVRASLEDPGKVRHLPLENQRPNDIHLHTIHTNYHDVWRRLRAARRLRKQAGRAGHQQQGECSHG
jgi:hypothetical protein